MLRASQNRGATVTGRAKAQGIFWCHLHSLALLYNIGAKCIPALLKLKSILVPCSPAKQGRGTSREQISIKCQEVEEEHVLSYFEDSHWIELSPAFLTIVLSIQRSIFRGSILSLLCSLFTFQRSIFFLCLNAEWNFPTSIVFSWSWDASRPWNDLQRQMYKRYDRLLLAGRSFLCCSVIQGQAAAVTPVASVKVVQLNDCLLFFSKTVR